MLCSGLGWSRHRLGHKDLHAGHSQCLKLILLDRLEDVGMRAFECKDKFVRHIGHVAAGE